MGLNIDTYYHRDCFKLRIALEFRGNIIDIDQARSRCLRISQIHQVLDRMSRVWNQKSFFIASERITGLKSRNSNVIRPF